LNYVDANIRPFDTHGQIYLSFCSTNITVLTISHIIPENAISLKAFPHRNITYCKNHLPTPQQMSLRPSKMIQALQPQKPEAASSSSQGFLF